MTLVKMLAAWSAFEGRAEPAWLVGSCTGHAEERAVSRAEAGAAVNAGLFGTTSREPWDGSMRGRHSGLDGLAGESGAEPALLVGARGRQSVGNTGGLAAAAVVVNTLAREHMAADPPWRRCNAGVAVSGWGGKNWC